MGHLPEVTFLDEKGDAVERKRVDGMSHTELRSMMVQKGFKYEPKPSPPGGFVGMYTRPHHFRNQAAGGNGAAANGAQRFVPLGGAGMHGGVGPRGGLGVHGGGGPHGGFGVHGIPGLHVAGVGPQGGLGVPGVTSMQGAHATQGMPAAQQQATASQPGTARASNSATSFFGSLLGNSFSAGKVTSRRRLLVLRDLMLQEQPEAGQQLRQDQTAAVAPAA